MDGTDLAEFGAGWRAAVRARSRTSCGTSSPWAGVGAGDLPRMGDRRRCPALAEADAAALVAGLPEGLATLVGR